MASSTTEGSGGRQCAFQRGARWSCTVIKSSLERKATVISYAVDADGIVTTARRCADAAASDQVLLVLLKSDYTLEPRRLGHARHARHQQRRLHAASQGGRPTKSWPEPYERSTRRPWCPYAHLRGARSGRASPRPRRARAQAFIRHGLRNSGGQMPPGAAHFTQAARRCARCAACSAAGPAQLRGGHAPMIRPWPRSNFSR